MTKHWSPTSIGGPGKLQCEAFISRSRRRILIYKSSKYHKPCWMTLTLTRTTRILTWKASDVELSLSKPSLELIAVRNVRGGGGNAHHRRQWGHHHRWRRLAIILRRRFLRLLLLRLLRVVDADGHPEDQKLSVASIKFQKSASVI